MVSTAMKVSMLFAVALTAVGCGRIGFGTVANQDAASQDGRSDGGPDAAMVVCALSALTCQDQSVASQLGPVASGSTNGAGNQFANSCGGAGEADVAFQWQAPIAGRYVFDTHGSVLDTVLALRDTCAVATVACNDDDPATTSFSSSISINLAQCQEIVAIVDGRDNSGAFSLNINRKCPGANLGNGLGTIAMGNTTNAGDSYNSLCGGDNVSDVAYTWTPPVTGRYQFDTDTSALDTVLSVRGSCINPELACNDDDSAATNIFSSGLSLNLTSGQPIVIVVDGRSDSGSFVLHAIQKCPGIDLATNTGLVVAAGTTIGQGDSFVSTCGGNGNPDVAYSWTAPQSRSYRFDTNGSALDTVLSARTDCITGPIIGCNDDDPIAADFSSGFTLSMTAGQTIALVVDGRAGSGSYRLTITPQ